MIKYYLPLLLILLLDPLLREFPFLEFEQPRPPNIRLLLFIKILELFIAPRPISVPPLQVFTIPLLILDTDLPIPDRKAGVSLLIIHLLLNLDLLETKKKLRIQNLILLIAITLIIQSFRGILRNLLQVKQRFNNLRFL